MTPLLLHVIDVVDLDNHTRYPRICLELPLSLDI